MSFTFITFHNTEKSTGTEKYILKTQILKKKKHIDGKV